MKKTWQVIIPCLILISWLVGSIPGTALAKDFSRTLTIPTNYTNGSAAAGKIAFTSPFPFTEGSSTTLVWEICVINADGTGQIRLTTTPKSSSNEFPAWSPDGRKIAFSGDHDVGPGINTGIYVMNADGGGLRRLTTKDRYGLHPAWSPDGTKIAFTSSDIIGIGALYRIYVMNADGSNPTLLTDRTMCNDTDPVWSPDGRQIAFVSDRYDRNNEICVMNADGSNVRRLTNNPTWDSEPAWSPDGTKIAFSSKRSGDYDYRIYVMNADGTNQRRLTSLPINLGDGYPAWSSDGTKIAFMSGRDGEPEIYLMNADGTNQTQLTKNVARYPAWFGGGVIPGPDKYYDEDLPPTSPTNLMAQAMSSSQIDLMWKDNSDNEVGVMIYRRVGTTGKYILLTQVGANVTSYSDTGLLPNTTYSYRVKAYNAKGESDFFAEASVTTPPSSITSAERKIAFASNRDGNWEIYVMNADGSNQTRLTNNSAVDRQPTWSPDGSMIVFYSDRDGTCEIYGMNADGTGLTQFTHNSKADWDPSWSPDDTRIVFVSHPESSAAHSNEICVIYADGSETQLTNNTADDATPSWSPDSRKIAFISDRDGNFEIYVMNADGTGQRRLTNNNVTDFHPVWSPDGAKILFMSDRDGNWEIYTMNPDGTNQRRITANPATDADPVWSPDGSRIAFYYSDREGDAEIYVMNADGTNQTRLTFSPGLDVDLAWFGD